MVSIVDDDGETLYETDRWVLILLLVVDFAVVAVVVVVVELLPPKIATPPSPEVLKSIHLIGSILLLFAEEEEVNCLYQIQTFSSNFSAVD